MKKDDIAQPSLLTRCLTLIDQRNSELQEKWDENSPTAKSKIDLLDDLINQLTEAEPVPPGNTPTKETLLAIINSFETNDENKSIINEGLFGVFGGNHTQSL